MLERIVYLASRLAPRWRRDEWYREWSAELAANPGHRRAELVVGALVHVAWLWRNEWSVNMVSADVRYAVRGLRRTPGFTLPVVIMLAIGIGATAAMFSVVDAVLIRSFGFDRIDRLVAVWPRVTVSPQMIGERSLASGQDSLFDGIGAYSGWGFTLAGADRTEMLSGARVTPNLFGVLGVPPLLGRDFVVDDQRPGAPVAIISERLWRRRFNADPGVVNSTVLIGNAPHRIVGVMPAGFEFPDRRSDLWLPIVVDPGGDDFAATFAVRIARLAPGVSREQADARLLARALDLQQQQPDAFGTLAERATVLPLREHFARDVGAPLLLLFGGVSLLLVIACTNVANLMLTRASSRYGELMVRRVLGASRVMLARQLFVETAVLATFGCVLGLLVAQLLLALVQPFAAPDVPNLHNAGVDGRVAGMAILVAALSAVVFGILPAFRAMASDAAALNLRGTVGQSGVRLRNVFAFVQIALAMLLVTVTAALGKSFLNLYRQDVGFSPEGVLTMRVSAPAAAADEADHVRDLYTRMLARINAVPGVDGSGVIQLLPLTAGNWNPGVRVEGVSDEQRYRSDINWRTVTPGYFAAMGIPLSRGRLLSHADVADGLPVAVVNETFQRVVLRDGDPVGRRIRTGFEPAGVWVTIVGVVGNVRQHALSEESRPEMYRPFLQHPVGSMQLMVKVAGDPMSAATMIRAAVADVDRNIATSDIEPMTTVVDRALGGTRFPLVLVATLAGIAVTIGLIGIAGVLAFDVHQRRPEIGIRIALGESPQSIRASVLRRALWVAGFSVAVGGGGAAAIGTAIEARLYGASVTDPLLLSGVAVACIAAVVAAAWPTAYRASCLDPAVTLRGS